MNFDYYYGDESNQFAFYRIPRQLITGEAFKKLSTDAKLLYGLLLDRMGLSAKNGWYDDMAQKLHTTPLNQHRNRESVQKPETARKGPKKPPRRKTTPVR